MIKTSNPGVPSKPSAVKRALWQVLTASKLDEVVKLLKVNSSYLIESGWMRSAREGKAVDRNGNPLPWLTYPFIQFIQPRLTTALTMYEYGAGNSTLWFAQHVGSIRSVEHDAAWYEAIRRSMPPNVTLVHRAIATSLSYTELTYMDFNDVQPYTEDIHEENRRYDLVLVDGVYRNRSIVNAGRAVSETGVIILDNVDYVEAREGIDYLLNRGFRRVEFWGMCPIVHHDSCTAVFYRDGNCLGL